jgi:hypothetical protein
MCGWIVTAQIRKYSVHDGVFQAQPDNRLPSDVGGDRPGASGRDAAVPTEAGVDVSKYIKNVAQVLFACTIHYFCGANPLFLLKINWI